MTLEPGPRVGAYEIVSHLGDGGMGLLYRVHDTRLDRFAALKLGTERTHWACGTSARILSWSSEEKADLVHEQVLAKESQDIVVTANPGVKPPI